MVRPVQISLDDRLLAVIDADPEVRTIGRSAFIRSAVRYYLDARSRRQTDEAILAEYSGQAESLLREAEGTMEVQEWPKK